jgi:methylase of polypeptide subunit release factors
MDLRISLYDTDNHSAISVVNSEQPQALINCPNDLELISEFAKLVIKLRKEQAANRNIVRVRVGFGNTATVE